MVEKSGTMKKYLAQKAEKLVKSAKPGSEARANTKDVAGACLRQARRRLVVSVRQASAWRSVTWCACVRVAGAVPPPASNREAAMLEMLAAFRLDGGKYHTSMVVARAGDRMLGGREDKGVIVLKWMRQPRYDRLPGEPGCGRRPRCACHLIRSAAHNWMRVPGVAAVVAVSKCSKVFTVGSTSPRWTT